MDLSPILCVSLSVSLSGKCIVANRLNGYGSRLGWWVGSIEGWLYYVEIHVPQAERGFGFSCPYWFEWRTMHVALRCGCSVPAAEWLDSSAVDIAVRTCLSVCPLRLWTQACHRRAYERRKLCHFTLKTLEYRNNFSYHWIGEHLQLFRRIQLSPYANNSTDQGWKCREVGGIEPPQFMSTYAHFWVKIGIKFQSLCKISNISTFNPQFF